MVGLYGTGRVGKTTISRAICNQMFADFSRKVCHIELGWSDQVELRRKVLRELAEALATILYNNSGKVRFNGKVGVKIMLDGHKYWCVNIY